MYHLVYLTTNLVNRKIYIGVHSTWNLDDGYLGSGDNILLALKKYGRNNFKRQILYFAYDRNQAKEYESMIVDKHFIKRKDTYNKTLGGLGVSDESSSIKKSKALTGIKRSDITKQKVSDSWVIRNKNKDPQKRSRSALKGEETKRKNMIQIEKMLRSIIEHMFDYFYFDSKSKVTLYNPKIDRQSCSYIRDKFPDGYILGSRLLYKTQDYSNFNINFNNPLGFLLDHKLN